MWDMWEAGLDGAAGCGWVWGVGVDGEWGVSAWRVSGDGRGWRDGGWRLRVLWRIERLTGWSC